MDLRQQAFTIAQFCELHGFSRALYYLLQRDGNAPGIMRAGRRVLISIEAAKEWRERMTARTATQTVRSRTLTAAATTPAVAIRAVVTPSPTTPAIRPLEVAISGVPVGVEPAAGGEPQRGRR